MGSGLLENFLPIQPKTSVNTKSGLTFNLPTNDVFAPRKCSRDSLNDHFTPSNPSFSTPQKPSNGLSQIPSFVDDMFCQSFNSINWISTPSFLIILRNKKRKSGSD
uniref:Uncharacterized protein n=1 Tax=Solanum demissum TaxID=50514 RepID=Q0KIM2_SOLDE|nr:hypothetical protein SDM1_49t00017 [Solanum demissum]